jgi:hypothetical protein
MSRRLQEGSRESKAGVQEVLQGTGDDEGAKIFLHRVSDPAVNDAKRGEWRTAAARS